MNQSSFRIKICGIRDPLLATETIAMGAEFIGIMTYTKSKRYIDLTTSQQVAQATKEAGGTPVAVFVDYNAHAMQAFCDACDIKVIQLHGSTPRTEHHLLPASLKRIYSLAVNYDGSICENTANGIEHLNPDRDILLVDGVNPGSGKSFAWDYFQYNGPFSYFLGGGLNTDNVKHAIRSVNPVGVDVSSGVEKAPGIKDKKSIRSFINAVRQC